MMSRKARYICREKGS